MYNISATWKTLVTHDFSISPRSLMSFLLPTGKRSDELLIRNVSFFGGKQIFFLFPILKSNKFNHLLHFHFLWFFFKRPYSTTLQCMASYPIYHVLCLFVPSGSKGISKWMTVTNRQTRKQSDREKGRELQQLAIRQTNLYYAGRRLSRKTRGQTRVRAGRQNQQ